MRVGLGYQQKVFCVCCRDIMSQFKIHESYQTCYKKGSELRIAFALALTQTDFTVSLNQRTRTRPTNEEEAVGNHRSRGW
jgi:hypothetical protein